MDQAQPDVAFASELVYDLSEMIEAAQKQVATVANAALTAPHRQIGRHGRTHVLEGRRAEYGGQIVSTASRQLAKPRSSKHQYRITEAGRALLRGGS